MAQFTKILVPVDFEPASDEAVEQGRAVPAGEHHVEFSPASLRAVEVAADLARQSKGKLLLVHITPTMHSSAMYTGPVSLPTGVIEEIEAKAKSTSLLALQHLRQTICPDVAVEHAIGPGQPAQAVLDEAMRSDADLIVMAASGRSRVARFFVGSTADRIIRSAPCPVLVIPSS